MRHVDKRLHQWISNPQIAESRAPADSWQVIVVSQYRTSSSFEFGTILVRLRRPWLEWNDRDDLEPMFLVAVCDLA